MEEKQKIFTKINKDLYNKIKSTGLKINYLIELGYKCAKGECHSALVYKQELEEAKSKLVEIETKTKIENENLIKKYIDEISELKIIKAYLSLLMQHLIKKYVKTKEQLIMELSEVFDEEKKEKFLKLIEDRKVFISLDI
ncbi:MAG: hypothetical protein QXI77_03800 [Nanopusillaceae archaeon]